MMCGMIKIPTINLEPLHDGSQTGVQKIEYRVITIWENAKGLYACPTGNNTVPRAA